MRIGAQVIFFENAASIRAREELASIKVREELASIRAREVEGTSFSVFYIHSCLLKKEKKKSFLSYFIFLISYLNDI